MNHITNALHASAPEGHGCADCAMDGEACPECYVAWWRKRHPNHVQVGGEFDNTDGVGASPAPGSEPFERWRRELRICIVQLLYVAHVSKSPAECKANPLYGSVMRLVDGGPSLAAHGVGGTDGR